MKKRKVLGKSLNDRFASQGQGNSRPFPMGGLSPLPLPITGDLTRPHIASFCADLVPDSTPIKLVATPTKGARVNECFPTVARHVVHAGGQMVCGWAIWEIPGVIIEGEFHGVWRSPTGELVDLSPPTGGDGSRLFLPDPARTWQDRQVNNVRKALADDPRVLEYIAAHDAHYEMLNSGERAEQFAVSVDAGELRPVMRRIALSTIAVAEMLAER